MTISIRPKLGLTIEGRNDKDQKFEHWIRATGGESDDTIKLTYFNFLPTTFNTIRYLSDYKVTEEAQGIWIGEATYSLITGKEPDKEDPLKIPVEFEIGGENVKLTHSLQTITSYVSSFAAFATAPDFKQAVNVTSSGVEGYEFEAPTLKWSETYFMPKALIYGGYLVTLRDLKNRTNTATFRGFDIGEVYFAGASGRNSQKFDEYYEINFKFVADKNLTGISIPGFPAIDKKAHELLWLFYQEHDDPVAKKTVKIPLAAYVERTREEADFADLQLPV